MLDTGILIAILVLLVYLGTTDEGSETNDPTGSDGVNAAFGGALVLFAALVWSPVIMTLLQTYWLRRGQTIGKAIFGLQVVQGDGSIPGFLRMIGRQIVQHLFFPIATVVTLMAAFFVVSVFEPWLPSSSPLWLEVAFTVFVIAIPPMGAVVLLARRNWTLWDHWLQTDVIRNAPPLSHSLSLGGGSRWFISCEVCGRTMRRPPEGTRAIHEACGP